MERVKRYFGVLLGVSALGAALACGPSFQAIYEGNARFEHCYALEENPQNPMREKADCWRDWSEHYTYGQTRDRIHYATARYVALSQAGSAPTDEAMMMAAPGMTPRQSTIHAPAPTNAFAPPPKVLDESDAASLPQRTPRLSETPVVVGQPGGSIDASTTLPSKPAASGSPAPTSTAPVEPAPLPGAHCSDACAKKFQDCRSGCTPGDAVPRVAKDNACTACDNGYKGCVRGCLK
jgi:hypothetical protein